MLIDFIAGTKHDFCSLAATIAAIEQTENNNLDIAYRPIYIGDKNDFSDSGLSLSTSIQPSIFLTNDSDANSTNNNDTVLTQYKKVLNAGRPDIVMLYGHSTGVMACAIAAAKTEKIRVAHVGSGTRNNYRYAENEINRKIIDAITDYHFSTSQQASENLRTEGVPDDYIFFVGNPIADVLAQITDEHQPEIWDALALKTNRYILLNLESTALLSSSSRLKPLLYTIVKSSRNIPIILPDTTVTRTAMEDVKLKTNNLHMVDIHSQNQLYYLAKHAKVVITDNENLQAETTIMRTPCITLFKSAAVPDTHKAGSNEIINLNPELLEDTFQKLFTNNWKKGQIPYLWDGKATKRILAAMNKLR